MAGAYVKIKEITFKDGKRNDYGSSGVNGIVESDYVMVTYGTDSVMYPKDTVKQVVVGATVAHLDTAFSTADALFT